MGKKDNGKAHIYITTAAAIIMLVFCILEGFEPARTGLIVIVTIAAFYLLSRITIAIVRNVFFPELPLVLDEEPPADGEAVEDADGDAEAQEGESDAEQ
jgi:hypothetical protein